jgi:hypothetical protein
MTPFLKKKQEASVSMAPETITLSDEGEKPFELLDAIVEDMIEAVHKKDKGLLKGALEALMDHMKEEDEVQDMAMES